MGTRIVLAVLVLALVACTGDTEDDPSVASDSAATTTVQEEDIDPGRLVVLDGSGDIIVMDPDGSNGRPMTDDAGESAIYTQPVWSPDGSTIAWGQVTESGFGVGIGEPGSEETTTVETSNLPFYISWSPDGRSLGVLHNGTTGVAFRIVDVAGGTGETLDEDTPFYFSWSPESDRVVVHAGESRVETIEPGGETVGKAPTSGAYLAPQWTDNGVFHVVADQLVLEDDEEERVPVAQVSGLTMFVANPEGTLVALQSTGEGGAITASTEDFPTATTNAVVVVDVTETHTEVVSDALALGFFWSPDGESLMILDPTEDGVAPRVWEADAGVSEFPAFRPAPNMVQDTFPFFPQYAQSVRFWAPDSSAFAYAGEVDGDAGVWVQSLADSTPIMVSDGSWVAWSPPRP